MREGKQRWLSDSRQLIIKTVTILRTLICIDAQSALFQSLGLWVTNGGVETKLPDQLLPSAGAARSRREGEEHHLVGRTVVTVLFNGS